MRAQAAFTALLILTGVGCAPQELVLRAPAVDWSRLGVKRIAVLAVAPRVGLKVDLAATSSARPIPRLPLDADSAVLAHESVEAAQLMSFALEQSAFDVTAASPRAASLELTVTSVTFSKTGSGLGAMADEIGAQDARIVDARYASQGDIEVKAVLEVRLILPGRIKPIWDKQGVGIVPFHPDQALFAGSSPLDPATVTLLRGIAVRRALGQLARELLPRYDYQELP